MKVWVQFLAFPQKVHTGYADVELPKGADVMALRKAVGEKWGKQLGAYWNEDTHEFAVHVLVASEGRMLQDEEKLFEDQRLSVIGKIIGG